MNTNFNASPNKTAEEKQKITLLGDIRPKILAQHR